MLDALQVLGRPGVRAEMHVPAHADHRFRWKPSTDSGVPEKVDAMLSEQVVGMARNTWTISSEYARIPLVQRDLEHWLSLGLCLFPVPSSLCWMDRHCTMGGFRGQTTYSMTLQISRHFHPSTVSANLVGGSNLA